MGGKASSGGRALNESHARPPSRRFLVPTVALDDLFGAAGNARLPPPRVVKVDVEVRKLRRRVHRGMQCTCDLADVDCPRSPPLRPPP